MEIVEVRYEIYIKIGRDGPCRICSMGGVRFEQAKIYVSSAQDGNSKNFIPNGENSEEESTTLPNSRSLVHFFPPTVIRTKHSLRHEDNPIILSRNVPEMAESVDDMCGEMVFNLSRIICEQIDCGRRQRP